MLLLDIENETFSQKKSFENIKTQCLRKDVEKFISLCATIYSSRLHYIINLFFLNNFLPDKHMRLH